MLRRIADHPLSCLHNSCRGTGRPDTQGAAASASAQICSFGQHLQLIDGSHSLECPRDRASYRLKDKRRAGLLKALAVDRHATTGMTRGLPSWVHRDSRAAVRCRLTRSSSASAVAGACVGYAVPTHFLETAHKENLYGSSKSTFAAGVFGPAPIPTLRLSLVDCEI